MAKYEFWGTGGYGCDKIEKIFETSQPVGNYNFDTELNKFLQNLFGCEKIHDLEVDYLMWLNLDSEFINISFGVSYGDYDWGLHYRMKAV